jgi:ribosomal-protein-alanine N-acetyltransferase
MQDLKQIQADEITILRAADKHVAAVVRIAEDSGLSHWSTKDYVLETRRHDSIFLAGEIPSGDVIGFIVGRIVSGGHSRESLTSEIYNIAVIPNFRRFGVGSRLLSSFIRIAASCSAKEVILEVRSQNMTAQTFYISRGFKPCGERKRFYSHPPDDAIIMKSRL